MRNRKSNPEGISPRDSTFRLHMPEYMVTTNPDRSVLIMIITWHFQFHPMNVSILQLKYEYRAQSASRFACYSHCYVTRCPLMTELLPHNSLHQGMLHSICATSGHWYRHVKFLKMISTTIKHIYKESANIIEGCNAAFYTNDCWNCE